MRLFFNNTGGWSHPYAILYSNDESIVKKVDVLKECENKYYIDFDNNLYNHVSFCGEDGEQSSKVFVGSVSIGVEYKENEAVGRNLTYFTCADDTTGRVDNYLLNDSVNLSYRDDKSKKISVFLPKSYDGITPHDILYFFDAQNLFSKAGHYTDNGDPYGSWQIDVVLNEVYRQFGKNIIVVGIDNADMYRSNELFMDPSRFGKLSPLATAIPEDDFSKGYLDNLSDFIIKTLHPFIKEKYCVKEGNIGIGGASMGGIASFYCGIKELGFYRYVLSYSPAYGLYEMDAFDNWFKHYNFAKQHSVLPKIHIYCGLGDQLEESLVVSSRAMKPLMIKYGYDEKLVFETYDNDKAHNEESWRLILPESFSLLLDL